MTPGFVNCRFRSGRALKPLEKLGSTGDIARCRVPVHRLRPMQSTRSVELLAALLEIPLLDFAGRLLLPYCWRVYRFDIRSRP